MLSLSTLLIVQKPERENGVPVFGWIKFMEEYGINHLKNIITEEEKNKKKNMGCWYA